MDRSRSGSGALPGDTLFPVAAIVRAESARGWARDVGVNGGRHGAGGREESAWSETIRCERARERKEELEREKERVRKR